MPDFSFLILYVDNPPKSAAFYADLLERKVHEQSPTFAMLPLSDAIMLGLWARQAVEPAATGAVGAGEIAFTAADAAALSNLHDQWAARGLTIVQAPTKMDFGTTFVALDPDGHRLRVFVPGAAS